MKCYFQQMKITACVIHLFDVFLTEELSCGTILIIKGHPQGQNVNVKVKKAKI